MKYLVLLCSFIFLACGATKNSTGGEFKAAFMPENHLFAEDDISKPAANGIDEAYFNSIIEKAQEIYAPIVAQFGANLAIEGNWSDSTVNAYANRMNDVWQVKLFGGLARRNEITRDGFALVICHEIGHHLAGYPLYAGQWAANEGNSDFYSTAGCAGKLLAENIPTPEPKPTPKTPCPFAPEPSAMPCKGFSFSGDTSLCQRSIDGALALGRLLAALGGDRAPSLETPDKSVVTKTYDSHPKAQCRLDTMVMGVMCGKKWNDSIIPINRLEMNTVSCGQRPACWFKA